MHVVPAAVGGRPVEALDETRTPHELIATTHGPAIVTRWRLSELEREAVARGADVLLLTYVGDAPPPDVQLLVRERPE